MTDAPPASASRAIGIFDSGVGGLTVARAILDQLPHEQLVYLGDTAHVRRAQADRRRCAGTPWPAWTPSPSEGVKLLVIACNAATAACLHDARERYPMPVVEVIRPAVRRAVAATRNGRVGVIGTQATITSRAYEDAFAAAPHIEVTAVACPQFVEFVERGTTTGRALLGPGQRLSGAVAARRGGTLVLGCTHYPLLAGLIGLVMGDEVTLVSSADETARDVYRVLTQAGLLRPDDAPPPEHRFLTTGDADGFRRLAHRFLGSDLVATVSGLGRVGAAR